MRLFFFAAALFMAACEPGEESPVYVTQGCEGDNMLCRTPFDRYVQVGWNESSTNPGFQVANRNGCEFIKLGSQDTVGGVLIVPQRNNESGLKAFLVTPDAPFEGFIDGPFQVLPIYIGLVPIALTTAPTLDLLVYERMPPSFSTGRGAFQFGTILTVTQTNTLTFNVRGRGQIDILIVEPVYASTETWTVSLEVYGGNPPATPGGTAIGSTFDTRTYATPAAAIRWSSSNTQGLSGSAPGSPMADRLIISNAGTGASTARVYVQAWD